MDMVGRHCVGGVGLVVVEVVLVVLIVVILEKCWCRSITYEHVPLYYHTTPFVVPPMPLSLSFDHGYKQMVLFF